MRSRIACLIAILTLPWLAAGCGSQIGDSCSLSTDCSPQGDRTCDTSSPGGYCTIPGCDYGTCPSEAVCVRFFSVDSVNLPCNPATEDQTTNDCSNDEICTLGGTCAPLSAESRFCMRKCSSNSDCRKNYECRTKTLMMMHGGEPVPAPGQRLGADPQGFCAPAPINN